MEKLILPRKLFPYLSIQYVDRSGVGYLTLECGVRSIPYCFGEVFDVMFIRFSQGNESTYDLESCYFALLNRHFGKL